MVQNEFFEDLDVGLRISEVFFLELRENSLEELVADSVFSILVILESFFVFFYSGKLGCRLGFFVFLVRRMSNCLLIKESRRMGEEVSSSLKVYSK